MESSSYPLFAGDTPLAYTFYSDGSRGRIEKLILYTRLQVERHIVFNLSLGDVDEKTNQIREDVVSGNADGDKIFRTVAKSISLICGRYSDAYIQILGNSLPKNRLYQMTILRQLEQVQLRYEVYGLVDNRWEEFQKNRQYRGFLLHVKKTTRFGIDN
jgi:hypothetical protein